MTTLHRRTLPNGLRVLIQPNWPTPRAAVSVHYGAGFRSEPPGSEGLAHLVEHLMFRGSQSLPAGRFYDALHPLGGTANGTTHPDYTDYFQVVPAEALEQALFREADRMRAPVFTESELASQLSEVGREIATMRDGRRYGRLPWPALPAVMFRSLINAHDGYGEIARLRDVTVDDCAAFFDATYVPSGAVLTIVTPHSADEVWTLVERHFGDVPGRAGDPPPDRAEPPADEHRRAGLVVPGVTRLALALGYRLPDPGDRLRDYVAYMVLARLAARWRHPGSARTHAGCGFFGPLDALAPDAFVVTSVLPDGVTPDGFVAELVTEWQRLSGRTAVRDEAPRAARELAAQHQRRHAGIEERCRALGRFEVLFARAELVDDLADLLAGTTAEQVAQAAGTLAESSRTLLIAGPADRLDEHLPPAVPPDAEPPAPVTPARNRRTAAELGAAPGGPRAMPPLGEPVAPDLAGSGESRLPNGLRVVAVPHHRAPVVELRLRVPLGPDGWREPQRVADLLRVLAARTDAARRVAAVGGELHLAQDGQWADVTGWAPPVGLTTLLTVVADLVRPAELPDHRPLPPQAAAPPSPQQRMDDALRRLWAGEPATDPADDLTTLHRRIFRPVDATLVLVGPLSASGLRNEAGAALGSWLTAGPAPQPRPGEDTRLLLVPDPVGPVVHLTLNGREPDDGSSESARYLTTALLGGTTEARLARLCRSLGHAELVMLARRDVLAGHRRASIRLAVPREQVTAAVDGIRAEVRALIADPPPADEVETARRYCTAQMLAAFDSPARLADALRHTTAAGRGLEWVVRRPALLGTPGPADLSAAAHDLFGAMDHVVVLGDDPGLGVKEIGA
ncbi:M16 family metallopeptidase [Actinoplanes xinjiangensis]|uniref:M16 family metallopeptidase n=1 Tax=Actinoplanes xinjiangensis TaxID=512350 RepID=UPI0034396F71